MDDIANANPIPLAEYYTVVAFVSISSFSSLVLVYLIFDFFKRRRGLYFWSLLVTTLGTILACVFCLIFIFRDATAILLSSVGVVLADTLISISNSLVLYSRVHLVAGGQRPRWILFMILGSFLLLQCPLVIGTPFAAAHHGRGNWTSAVLILQKLSVVCYCVREMIMIGFYAWATFRNLQPLIFLRGDQGRQLITALTFAGAIWLALDIANLIVEFTVSCAVGAAFFPFIFSTKLLVEFAALSKLIRFITRDSDGGYDCWTSTGDYSDHHTRHHSLQSNQPLTSPHGVVLETKSSRTSDHNPTPQYTHHSNYTRDLLSIDASDSHSVDLATPPQVHSADHLYREMSDLEAGRDSREVPSSQI
ncbi:hypothetical protein BO78DRAFT_434169 [Aspergillus sclerotiicarbonarius CBS 121057]|uniref:DUF7703 domain-containing protein n=1 Tax=Aspergillus sclerotiicarbonarius (strain CBS 121057 / IBT 28362) TaxID=1448318 RepID=A0A319DSS4_ASPSB|nr:hypothetical protein BO78DRAFT_434169 [Aspergillus sclerotiicarbonarius CBS 121057]